LKTAALLFEQSVENNEIYRMASQAMLYGMLQKTSRHKTNYYKSETAAGKFR